MKHVITLVISACLALIGVTGVAHADTDYPTRPVRVIVP